MDIESSCSVWIMQSATHRFWLLPAGGTRRLHIIMASAYYVVISETALNRIIRELRLASAERPESEYLVARPEHSSR